MDVEITSRARFRSSPSQLFWRVASLIKTEVSLIKTVSYRTPQVAASIKTGDGKKTEVETYF